MEAIRIVLAASSSSMLLVMMMMIIISSASAELTEEAPSPSRTTAAAASAPLNRSDDLFTMQFRIGGTEVFGIADTGSGIIWTNNSQWLLDDPVMRCPSDNDDGIITSPSCDGRLCTFTHKYGSGDVKGVMGKAKLRLFGGGASGGGVDYYNTPNPITIGSALMSGCHHHLSSSSSDDDHITAEEENGEACKVYARGGVVGLNRDKQSLARQLWLDNFSYCFPHHKHASATGQIKFNDTAAVSSPDGTTPPKLQLDKLKYEVSSSYYVVGLKKILVGEKIAKNVQADDCSSLNKDHRLSSDDDGAMLIDSGTKFTILPQEVFKGVKEKVENLLKEKLKENFKKVNTKEKEFSCYKGTTYPDRMDSIVLDFCSKESRMMEIPPKNYFFERTIRAKKEKIFCLAFTAANNPEDKKSILGAYQQQDMHMLFDIKDNTLTFAKSEACGSQSEPHQEENHATM